MARGKFLLAVPPVIFSFIAFVLAIILLLAGTGPQQRQLEPYHIIAVNISGFGQDLVSSATQTSSSSEPSATSIWDEITGEAGDIGDDIEDELNDLVGDAADEIIEELGISDWYSLHIMAICEGMFANSSDAYNTTNCTVGETGLRLNLSAILDHEIDVGPLDLNLNQVPIPDKVQTAINLVNDALKALFVIYVLAIAFSGLSVVSSALAGIVMLFGKSEKSEHHLRLMCLGNLVISSIATLLLLISSAIVTYINNKGVKEINDAGKDVGISGIKGLKFITLTWIAFGLAAASTLVWTLAFFKNRLPSRRGGRSGFYKSEI
ncbi:actin cortical patch SUR7/pH-response regulator pali [Xylariaceae sp. FL1272]|nr:actin cortical patch SUR7/pH-response regulator pali [Xylariaceae sp. FL1272]